MKIFTFLGNLIYSGPREKTGNENLAQAIYVEFDTLLKQSHIIIIACSLNPTTCHLFNLETFKKMRSDAILINGSRGCIIQQDDLIIALNNKIIAAAGLDVTTPEPLPLDHPLLNMSNVTVFPHIGSATIETREMMANVAIDNLLNGLKGYPLKYPVKD